MEFGGQSLHRLFNISLKNLWSQKHMREHLKKMKMFLLFAANVKRIVTLCKLAGLISELAAYLNSLPNFPPALSDYISDVEWKWT